MPEYQFGQPVETVYTVPPRQYIYVRSVRIPRGRMNAGVWHEVTDGKGEFHKFALDAIRCAKNGPQGGKGE